MDSKETNAIILEKLDHLSEGQTEIEKNMATILERIDQRDEKYCTQFTDIKETIKKGSEGRKVLHQKQDEIEKKIEEIKPDILFVKAVRKNINKVVGWAVLVIVIGIILTALPKIIEVIK